MKRHSLAWSDLSSYRLHLWKLPDVCLMVTVKGAARYGPDALWEPFDVELPDITIDGPLCLRAIRTVRTRAGVDEQELELVGFRVPVLFKPQTPTSLL